MNICEDEDEIEVNTEEILNVTDVAEGGICNQVNGSAIEKSGGMVKRKVHLAKAVHEMNQE